MIPKTHVIHAPSKFNYIFSSRMHSKRYSQEEVKFRSQMLYHSYLFKCMNFNN
jgi:hypothetical protein